VVSTPQAEVASEDVSKPAKDIRIPAKTVGTPRLPARAVTRTSLQKNIAPKHPSDQMTASANPKRPEVKQATSKDELKKVPTLNGFDEDEDTSLRLAELFEDVGGTR
jgi:hypothetical protein